MGGRTRNLPKNAPIILLFLQKFEKLSTDLSPFTNELASVTEDNRPQGSASVLGEGLALNDVCPSDTKCLDKIEIDNSLHPSPSYTFLKVTYSSEKMLVV